MWTHLAKNKGESQSQLDYVRVLESLMYVMNCTRPDIACVISKLSRYTSNSNHNNWLAMKRDLGYLDDTKNYALHYNRYLAVLEGYSDANRIIGQLKRNPRVDMFSLLVEEQYLGNHPNKHV